MHPLLRDPRRLALYLATWSVIGLLLAGLLALLQHVAYSRAALVMVPPRVWHGTQNISDERAIILNLVDHAYEYESPDHWRVPHDSAAIPFRF